MSYTKPFYESVSFPSRQYKNVTFTDFSVTRLLQGSRTGERMPDWREKLRNGTDATTPFQSDRYRFQETKGGTCDIVCAIPGNPGAGTQKHGFTGWGFPPSEVLAHLTQSQATAEAEALRIAYKKVNSEISHLAGASSLAEFADVLKQFGHPFQAIVDLTNRRLNRLQLEARGLRGSVVFRKKKWHEIVASTWLEYAFGLAPLISDTKKAAEALARLQFEKTGDFHPRSKVVARGSSKTAIHNVQFGSAGNTWITGRNTTKTETERRVQYVIGLSASVTADYGSNDRLIELLGFRPQDWIPAAWEVVPWSWLADYFTNVGDILAATATSTGGITWVSKTVTDVTTRTSVMPVDITATKSTCQSQGWPLQTISGNFLGSSVTVRTTVNRLVNQTLSVPPLVFQLPDRFGQFANMAAVLLARKPQSSALWLY